MKKKYIQPTVEVAKIQVQTNLLQASVTTTGLTTPLDYGGSGNAEDEGM